MKIKILSNLIYGIIKLFEWSYRFKYLDDENLIMAISKLPKPQYIGAFWHNNIIGSVLTAKIIPHIAIISASKDGELLSNVLKKMGILSARGSSHRGGSKAKSDMLSLLETGYPGAISVDGPTGPVYGVKRGIIDMCKEKGIPILPYASFPASAWIIEKAWDKFRIPKPFSTVYFKVCDPIWIPADLELKDYAIYQEKIKEELLKGEEELKRKFL